MNDGLNILIDAARYLAARGNIDNDALQLLDNAMVRVMREPEMPHALDGTCWCLREQREYTALDYMEGLGRLAGAIQYLARRQRLDVGIVSFDVTPRWVLERAYQDVLDAWQAGQRATGFGADGPKQSVPAGCRIAPQ